MSQRRKPELAWMVACAIAVVLVLNFGTAGVSRAALTSAEAVVLEGGDSDTDRTTPLVTLVQNADGSVTLAFKKQNTRYPPQAVSGVAEARVGTSLGAFVGDYAAAGVAGLKFKAASDGTTELAIAATLQASLPTGGSRVWKCYAVSVSPEGVENTVPLTRAAGWDVLLSDDSVDKDALWQEDLKNVTMIGVSVVPNAYEAQSCTIDEFKLVDASGLESGAAPLTLAEILAQRFGAEIDEVEAKEDSDADGMTDLNEIMTESDQEFEDSTFAAEVVSVDGDAATVRWACRRDRNYTLYRAVSLTGGFAPVSGVVGVVADETGYMTVTVDGPDSGSYFYRVRKSD